MINPFVFSNSGHDLSIMLNNVDYILKNNIKHILILQGYKNQHNFKLISLLLPEDCVFYELDINKIYKIQNIIIIKQLIFDITYHKYLIDRLNDTIKNKYSKIYNDYKNKNVILIKSNRNPNVMRKYFQINCEKMLINLENSNWTYLIPENIDIFQLCIYLLYANKIIFSDGAILYTNKLFFNINATHIYIGRTNDIECSDYNLNSKIKLKLIYHNQNLEIDDQYITMIKKINDLI